MPYNDNGTESVVRKDERKVKDEYTNWRHKEDKNAVWRQKEGE